MCVICDVWDATPYAKRHSTDVPNSEAARLLVLGYFHGMADESAMKVGEPVRRLCELHDSILRSLSAGKNPTVDDRGFVGDYGKRRLKALGVTAQQLLDDVVRTIKCPLCAGGIRPGDVHACPEPEAQLGDGERPYPDEEMAVQAGTCPGCGGPMFRDIRHACPPSDTV